TDGERIADENNPRGYYEHEAVKALKRNKAFLKDANGKTLKVIAQLLPHLPLRYRYRIVFVERDLLEIVASQQKMLVRAGKRVQTDTLPLNLVEQYKKTLQKVKTWAANQPNVEIHFVKHQAIMNAPFAQAMLMNDFFDGTLLVERMAGVVDQALHRERTEAATAP
ncbi:MAG: sulfotransferase family protein, partial [Bacteroidota bacterium]